MELAAQQLLRAIRGRRSQVGFARRLGYRSNPITDWERGKTFPTAEEALRACERVGLDPKQALRRFSGVELDGDGSGYRVGPWLARVVGVSSTELARRMGRSRSSVSRWLSGFAKPRLPAFLSLLDAASGRVHDLVAELVPIEQVPALFARHQAALAAKRIAFDAPWTEAILRVLETVAYRRLPEHDTAWLAALLRLPSTEVDACLALLREANIAHWDGSRFTQARPLSVDTQGGKRSLHALKAHWARVASERASAPLPGDLFAYNVMSISEADLQRVRAMLRATYRDVRAVVAASEPSERAALLNVQLMSWSAG